MRVAEIERILIILQRVAFNMKWLGIGWRLGFFT